MGHIYAHIILYIAGFKLDRDVTPSRRITIEVIIRVVSPETNAYTYIVMVIYVNKDSSIQFSSLSREFTSFDAQKAYVRNLQQRLSGKILHLPTITILL